ncbi:cbb3-type cytochrome oxidase assembly protein CcoS [Paroceanicella profunda]|uniref:Cbb3-type cytochrome oxidase assembly protein CcoS n=1 Tax=Paroceanicella profunda TaxID=2579971 RepID=A0A5B8FV68_9RHOB|nr:cbb3-type cytochrome oxidase assembly protein CcoS [Paroceanicella profunda]QDL92696.1 cbb3-type cytochrome oxidase assembly protein CcoS [Paroceanicella profunda]
MTILALLIPISLFLGLCGLGAFLWTLRSGQYRDIEGDAQRILLPDDPDPVIDDRNRSSRS